MIYLYIFIFITCLFIGIESIVKNDQLITILALTFTILAAFMIFHQSNEITNNNMDKIIHKMDNPKNIETVYRHINDTIYINTYEQ